MLDAVDRQIIHILAIEPRASFRTLAEVTGISDQTAARRYRRLSESAGLRVLGVVDGSQLGWTGWFLRLQTTPGSADSIAEALARRPDTSWVRLASGGTEIACTLEARTAEQRDALFLRGLPGSRRVVQISAYSILHDFTPGPWQEITCALSAAQLDRLNASAAPAGAAGGGVLLPGDEPLLAELARDGRASHAALAAAIHWHESTVRRRMDELRRAGLLSFEIDIDNRVFGMDLQAMLWLIGRTGPAGRDGTCPGRASRDPVRRRHDRTDQPDGQCRLPRYSASLRIPHRRTGRVARSELGADRADHPDPQAHRLSSLAGPRVRQAARRPAADWTAADWTAAGWNCCPR